MFYFDSSKMEEGEVDRPDCSMGVALANVAYRFDRLGGLLTLNGSGTRFASGSPYPFFPAYYVTKEALDPLFIDLTGEAAPTRYDESFFEDSGLLCFSLLTAGQSFCVDGTDWSALPHLAAVFVQGASFRIFISTKGLDQARPLGYAWFLFFAEVKKDALKACSSFSVYGYDRDDGEEMTEDLLKTPYEQGEDWHRFDEDNYRVEKERTRGEIPVPRGKLHSFDPSIIAAKEPSWPRNDDGVALCPFVFEWNGGLAFPYPASMIGEMDDDTQERFCFAVPSVFTSKESFASFYLDITALESPYAEKTFFEQNVIVCLSLVFEDTYAKFLSNPREWGDNPRIVSIHKNEEDLCFSCACLPGDGVYGNQARFTFFFEVRKSLLEGISSFSIPFYHAESGEPMDTPYPICTQESRDFLSAFYR